MPRFEMEVSGENLARAWRSLNDAHIPTITDAGEPGMAIERPRPGSWFLRGALPILIVLVLAFLVQGIVGESDDEGAPSYDRFLELVQEQPQAIRQVTLLTEATEIEVILRDGDEYTIDYPQNSEESLVSTLQRQGVEISVDSDEGSSVLRLILYILPFLLLFGFWVFLMARMRRRAGSVGSPGGGFEAITLTAVVDAESGDHAENVVRSSLPTDGDYRVRRARR